MKEELQTLSKGSYSLKDYLHTAKSLDLSIYGAGKPIDDDDFIICILHGLWFEFNPIIAAFNARDMFSFFKAWLANYVILKSGFKIPKLLCPMLPFT